MLLTVVLLGAWAEFKNFSVIVNNDKEGSLLTSAEQVGGTAVSFGVAVDGEGTVSRVAVGDASSVATVSGTYHSDHGCTGLSVVVPVEGNVKITVGQCTYSSNTITVKNGNGETVVSKTPSSPACWKNSRTNVDELYYNGGATTLTISGMGYCPYVAVEAINVAPQNYSITYSLGGETAEGTLPASEEVTDGDSYTLPKNFTLYKEGYTLTGWNDGTTTHVPGTSIMPSADMVLTPVFTSNGGVTLAGTTGSVVMKWDFQRKNGAPLLSYEHVTGIYVTQAVVNGTTIDVKLDFDTTNGGKIANGSWNDWCQMNNGTKFTVPSKEGAVVEIEAYADMSDLTIDGSTEYTPGKTVSKTITSTGSTIEVVIGSKGSYYRYIQVTYPGTVDPWTNYQDFELDLRNGAYLTSSETSLTKIGFKKSGDAVVRTTAEDSEAIGTLEGKYHSNEHGLQNFSMTVAVPGYVKISAGTCAWGGNLTISSPNGFSKTVNTNTGACYHQNTTANIVVAYYNVDEGTTLTISGGNYMPFIAIERVSDVPEEYTVRFYNGEELVDTRSVFAGTGLGTLPAAPAVAEGRHFRGWYTSCDAAGVKATASTVPTASTDYHAYIMDVNKDADGKVLVTANDGQSFLNAVEYCSENAGDDMQKIYVPNGTYDLGSACRTEVKKNIAILGESMAGVVIRNTPAAAGIQSTSTLRITGDNVFLQNLTLQNDFDYSSGEAYGVAVALEINGDRSICNNVQLLSNQDTYYSNGSVSQSGYFKGGRIAGTVDYVCGSGNMWFEGTEFYNNARSNADVIFAPSTNAGTAYGYVASNCTVDGADNQAGKFNIARPWQGSPAATLINTTFRQLPSSAGYTSMGSGLVLRFHEYNSKDASGNAVTGHNLNACSGDASSDELYLSGIGVYTYDNVLGAWNPEAVIAAMNPTETVSGTITASGYNTFSSNYALDLSTLSGGTAYVATEVSEGRVMLTKTTAKVPARTGLFIAGTANAPFTVNTTADDATLTGTNLLVALPDGGLVDKGNNTASFNYVFGWATTDNPGFYLVNSTLPTLGAGKAYLHTTAAVSGSRLSLVFDDETSAIQHPELRVQDAAVYDLQGRRVAGASFPTIEKGLYIKNGKKMIIK
jgi:hypothetical protein